MLDDLSIGRIEKTEHRLGNGNSVLAQGDVRGIYVNIWEARDALEYEPQVSLKDGLSTLMGKGE